MPFQIYHENKTTDVLGTTIKDVENYFKRHHPSIRGFSLRSLNTPGKWINDKFTYGAFVIKKVEERKYKRADKEISNYNYSVFSSNTQLMTFNNKVVLNHYNMYELIQKIIDKIKRNSTNSLKNKFFRVGFVGAPHIGPGGRTGVMKIFTHYMNINNLFEEMIKVLNRLLDDYDSEIDIKKIVINQMQGLPSQNVLIYGNNVKQYDAYIISLENLIDNMTITNKCNKKLLKLSNDNFIFRPRTTKNCFIHSCYMAIKNKYTIKTHVDKFLERHPIEDYTLEAMAKHCSYYLKRRIKIYILNGVLERLIYNETNAEEEISILIVGCHAHALINREEVKKFDPDYLNELLNYKGDDEQQVLIEEPEEEKGKYNDFKVMTYDFETCDSSILLTDKHDTIPYALGLYDGEEYKEFYKSESNNIVDDFLTYIENCKYDKILLYAHNGGKFDIYLLIKELMTRKGWCITAFLEQMGRIINLECIEYNSHKRIIFRDSYNFISCSLDDACKSFNTKTKKLEGDVNHSLINIDNCHTNKIYEYTKEYLKNDCLSLYEILDIYDAEINGRFGISIKNVLTNASITRKLFLKKYYSEERPLYSLPKSIDKEIRKYYFGGRNECMTKLGYMKGKFFYLDFTSLYPHMMAINEYPYGQVEEIDATNKEFDKNWFGFVKCRFRNTNYDNIPLHAVLKDNKLLFPHCDTWQESVLSTEEIKYSLNNNLGYEYEYIKVFNYQSKGFIFKECVEDLYKMKINAETEGKDALRSIAKILNNSLYGFWGINHYNRDQIELVKIRKEKATKTKEEKTVEEVRQYKLQCLLLNQKLKDYNIINKYDIYNKTDKIKANCANVGIAAMVTSYARMYLYKLLKDIKDAGGKVYYMDTDSIVTDYNIYDNKILCDKWVGTGGTLLGELKNETGLPRGFYTELITLGNKFYALKNNALKKKSIILKAKGVNSKSKYEHKHIDHANKMIYYTDLDRFEGKNQMTFMDFYLMEKNYNLQCDCMNFISGINEMIIKDKGLVKIENTKTVHSLYDKGQVDEFKNITPLII